MTPDEQKTIDRLVESVNRAYGSSAHSFWRGFLWGLGRGLGATVGLALIIGISIYLLKASGLDETFSSAMKSLDELSKSMKSIRQ